MSIQLLGPVVLTMVVASSAVIAGVPAAAGGTNERFPSISDALRRFDATDLEGHRWTPDDFRGRVVLIDFWATWCAPCLAELPRLKALRSRYSRSDFEILGISLDATGRQSLVSWLNRNRLEWPQVHQRAGYAGALARLFGVEELPRSIVIARDGTVAAIDVRGPRLAQLVDGLVADRGHGHDPAVPRERGTGSNAESGVRR